MITAIYARKSTGQHGVSEEARRRRRWWGGAGLVWKGRRLMLEHRGHAYKIEASGGVFQGTVWPPGTDRGHAPGLVVVKEWIDRHGEGLGKGGAVMVRPPFKAEEIAAVRRYLQREFPSDEIDDRPQGDQLAHLFRVVRWGRVVHEVLIRRLFFDLTTMSAIEQRVAAAGLASKMHEAGSTRLQVTIADDQVVIS